MTRDEELEYYILSERIVQDLPKINAKRPRLAVDRMTDFTESEYSASIAERIKLGHLEFSPENRKGDEGGTQVVTANAGLKPTDAGLARRDALELLAKARRGELESAKS